jgi:hypothetical protein
VTTSSTWLKLREILEILNVGRTKVELSEVVAKGASAKLEEIEKCLVEALKPIKPTEPNLRYTH